MSCTPGQTLKNYVTCTPENTVHLFFALFKCHAKTERKKSSTLSHTYIQIITY